MPVTKGTGYGFHGSSIMHTDAGFKKLLECGHVTGTFSEDKIKGDITINDLLDNYFVHYVGGYEIPKSLSELLTVDDINAIITWYHRWRLNEPVATQTTCTIKSVFGYYDGMRVIIAINLFKYLRNKTYDPDVIEKILTT